MQHILHVTVHGALQYLKIRKTKNHKLNLQDIDATGKILLIVAIDKL